MKSSIRSVIFDMDGVLIDSPQQWDLAVQPYLSGQLTDWNHEKELEVAGLTLKDMHSLLVSWGFKPSFEEFYRFSRETAQDVYLRRVSLLPGVIELLHHLLHRDFSIGLGSCAPAQCVEMVLTRFDIRTYFQRVVTGDDVVLGKPAPDIFLLAAKYLQIPPEQCLVIEDTTAGVIAAKSAGMSCIALTNTLPKDKLTQADKIVSSMAEIITLFS